MTTETAKITTAGLAAAIAANGSGVELHITHVALGAGQHTPTGSETALTDLREITPVLVGSKSGNQVTLTASFLASFYSGSQYSVGEIGFYAGDPLAGGTLFAIISSPTRAAPIRGGSSGTNYVPTFVLALSGTPSGSVTVTFDPAAGAALSALNAHTIAADPHPVYLKKAGGTMTGNLILAHDAALPLEPVTKQQFEAGSASLSLVDSSGWIKRPIGAGEFIVDFWCDVPIGDVPSGAGNVTAFSFPLVLNALLSINVSPLGDATTAAMSIRNPALTGASVHANEWSGYIQNMRAQVRGMGYIGPNASAIGSKLV